MSDTSSQLRFSGLWPERMPPDLLTSALVDHVSVALSQSTTERLEIKITVHGSLGANGTPRRTYGLLTVEWPRCVIDFDIASNDAWVPPFIGHLTHFEHDGPKATVALHGKMIYNPHRGMGALKDTARSIPHHHHLAIARFMRALASALAVLSSQHVDDKLLFALNLIRRYGGRAKAADKGIGRSAGFTSPSSSARTPFPLLKLTEFYADGSWEHIRVKAFDISHPPQMLWNVKLYRDADSVGLEIRHSENPSLLVNWPNGPSDSYGYFFRVWTDQREVHVMGESWNTLEGEIRSLVTSIASSISDQLVGASVEGPQLTSSDLAFWTSNGRFFANALQAATTQPPIKDAV